MKLTRWTLPLLVLAALPVFACHAAKAADPPRLAGPAIDVEVDDREADKSTHVARFSLVLVNGHASVSARDGSLYYDLKASTPSQAPSRIELSVQRRPKGDWNDLAIDGSLASSSNARVILGKVERADGHTTTVTAQYH